MDLNNIMLYVLVKKYGSFHEVVDFIRLFLKSNRFICHLGLDSPCSLEEEREWQVKFATLEAKWLIAIFVVDC